MMSDFPQKINNSYESGSNSSSTGSGGGGDQANLDESYQSRLTDGVAALMEGADLYNTSAEEGIFPNVKNHLPEVPSYSRPWEDYQYNEYSNTPLVYSWLPIVPGFAEDGTDNLHNFEHIQLRSHNVSIESVGLSEEIPDQNEKFKDQLARNHQAPEPKQLSSFSKGLEFHEMDNNSCNAVDLDISFSEKQAVDPDLSFNGKIAGLKLLGEELSELMLNIHETSVDNVSCIEILPVKPLKAIDDPDEKVEDAPELPENPTEPEENLPGTCDNPQEPLETVETEEQRLHNESLELLKLEDSSRMLLLNEKSPEPSFEEDIPSDTDNEPMPEIDLRECDSSVLLKLRTSLAGICPPPSVTRFQMSLTDMLTTYSKNLNEVPPAESAVKSSSFFVPSHDPAEVKTMEWPALSSVRCLDVAYNKSTDSEHIEELCLRYSERFIGAETASSFNFKISASSAKKKIERLKLTTQSPGRRLSHLAKRRTIFSSDSLKSSSSSSVLSSSHSSFPSRLMIDRKLLAKTKSPRKRTSAKKKTPKRRTPKSAKRQAATTQSATSSRASSKRALFMSPVEAKPSTSQLVVAKEIPERGRLPRRTLFSPDEQKKRRRSPEIDTENRFEKQRRMYSPARLHKSQSFSVAPSTSTSSDHCRKKLFERTQSELVVTAPSGSKKGLGFTQPLTDEHKKKLLWSVSSVLKSKNIGSDHENFNKFAKDLSKLVKKVFLEFYDPSNPSVSKQMQRFANYMVAFVIKGEDPYSIYLRTKAILIAKHSTKPTGYLSQKDFELNQRRNNSLLLASQSCSSLNLSHSDGSFSNSTFNLSSSSLNRSSSKSNDVLALRENFLNSTEKSARKIGSDSNLNKQPSSVNSNLLKAKRQISF